MTFDTKSLPISILHNSIQHWFTPIMDNYHNEMITTSTNTTNTTNNMKQYWTNQTQQQQQQQQQLTTHNMNQSFITPIQQSINLTTHKLISKLPLTDFNLESNNESFNLNEKYFNSEVIDSNTIQLCNASNYTLDHHQCIPMDYNTWSSSVFNNNHNNTNTTDSNNSSHLNDNDYDSNSRYLNTNLLKSLHNDMKHNHNIILPFNTNLIQSNILMNNNNNNRNYDNSNEFLYDLDNESSNGSSISFNSNDTTTNTTTNIHNRIRSLSTIRSNNKLLYRSNRIKIMNIRKTGHFKNHNLHSFQRQAANMRERRRMQSINKAFEG